jgi:peptidyl-prolyl cis-trans isomerase D
MLRILRKHAKYFYVLFGLIIFTFIFWGVGGVDQNQVLFVIEVGEDRVTVEEYWRAYDRVSDLYRDIYQEKFDDEMREELKDEVLENMVSELLLLRASVEAGIKVSDREVEEAITNDPTFQREGVFSSEIYQRTLELNRITPTQFETAKRRELFLTKMKRLIEDSVDISPMEFEDMKGDEKVVEAIKSALIEAKKKAALNSYLEGLKGKVEIKVDRQLIS